MGLDITAYKNVKLIENAEVDSDGYPLDYDNHQICFVNSNFPSRECQMIHCGIYDYGDESYGFRAGSYGGYNQFRSELARLAGFKCQYDYWDNAKESDPFYELIIFADNEGVIGASVSMKLLADFNKNKTNAESVGGYFYDRYLEWIKAFELASQNGFVDFH